MSFLKGKGARRVRESCSAVGFAEKTQTILALEHLHLQVDEERKGT